LSTDFADAVLILPRISSGRDFWSVLTSVTTEITEEALMVYEVNYSKLNTRYLQEWIQKLDLQALWDRLTDQAEIT
jgi:hypothetical protein